MQRHNGNNAAYREIFGNAKKKNKPDNRIYNSTDDKEVKAVKIFVHGSLDLDMSATDLGIGILTLALKTYPESVDLKYPEDLAYMTDEEVKKAFYTQSHIVVKDGIGVTTDFLVIKCITADYQEMQVAVFEAYGAPAVVAGLETYKKMLAVLEKQENQSTE